MNYNLIKTENGEKVAIKDSDFSRKPNNYTDVAEYYDFDMDGKLNEDIPFYIDYAKKMNPDSILELCSGTGRVSIELASIGYNVTAIDSSLPMLKVFERKVMQLENEKARRINIIYGNAILFNLKTTFDMILMPYRSFQQFAHKSEAIKSLECIREHLSDNGIFILDVYHPKDKMDETWVYPKKHQWTKKDASGKTISKYHWGNRINVEHKLIYPVLCYEIEGLDGVKDVIYEDLTLKYYYYDELVSMITDAGFEIREEYGDYKKCSIRNGSDYIFVLAKKKA